MKKICQYAAVLIGTLSLAALCAADCFDRIKEELADASCVRIAFVSIVESEIFDVVDSTFGTAYIARDGRYHVRLGSDSYLYDGHFLHSYSEENNQVVVEQVDTIIAVGSTVSFITRLDEFYKTQRLKADREYRLRKKSDSGGDLPDSMIVAIDPEKLRIVRLEYLDINEEPNTIILLEQSIDSICVQGEFEPAFPDSVEVLKLP